MLFINDDVQHKTFLSNFSTNFDVFLLLISKMQLAFLLSVLFCYSHFLAVL